MKTESKSEILGAMKILIEEGEQLTTGNYNGSNPDVFREFAEVNGFNLDEVIEVYEENEKELEELYSSRA